MEFVISVLNIRLRIVIALLSIPPLAICTSGCGTEAAQGQPRDTGRHTPCSSSGTFPTSFPRPVFGIRGWRPTPL